MSGGGREAPPSAARLDDLPPDVVESIAELLIQQCSPLFDRHDTLQLAATLCIAGGATCTRLAQTLFAFLSPRLGQELEVCEGSSVAELKAACKAWGLPVGGNKQALLQRLTEQVEDSKVDSEGSPPEHCLVSASTRAELSGWRQQRISQSKAKEIFSMTKGDLSGLPFQWMHTGGFAAKAFLLSDVKAEALRRYKSWDNIVRTRQHSKDFINEWQARTDARKQDVRQALLGRGHTVSRMEALLEGGDSGIFLWGNKSDAPVGAACDSIELHEFSRSQAPAAFAMALLTDPWQAGKSTSQYKAEWTKRDRASRAALPHWAAAQPTLQSIRGNPRVPRSLLPSLEQMWQQHQAQQPQQEGS